MQTNRQQLSRCYSTLHRCTCFSGVAQNSSRITSFLIHVYLCCPCMSNCIALPIPIKRAMNKNDNDIISLDLLSQNALDDAHIFIRSPLIRRSPASDHERLATMSTPSRRDEERNQPHRFRNADVIRGWSVKSFVVGASHKL